MNYLFFLLIVYFAYAIIAIVFNEGRILAPGVVFSVSFLLMLILAYMYKDRFGFVVGWLTFKVLSLGGFLFVFTNILVATAYRYKRNNIIVNNDVYLRGPKVSINNFWLNLFLVILVISTVLTFYILVTNTSGSFTARMNDFKYRLVHSSDTIRGNAIKNQLFKVDKCIAYFTLYVLVYRIAVYKDKFRNMVKHALIVFLFCISQMIGTGARQPVVECILFIIIVYLSLIMRKVDQRKIYKLIRKAIPALIVFVVVFYYSQTLVGKNQSERGLIDYFTIYLCGGLYSFNLHINEPARNAYFGQASFSDIYNFMSKTGLVPKSAVSMYHSFDLYGNTVTIFGRWYEDFGQIGVYVMAILVSLFFSIIFYKKIVLEANASTNNHVARILYCTFLISLVWASYDDRIRSLLSMATLVFVPGIATLYYLCIYRNIRIKFI